MYRGTSDFFENGLVENKYLKTARTPRDTDLFIHKVSDNWFFSTFGVKARSQTIFCSLSKTVASKYLTSVGGLYHVSIPSGEKYSIILSSSVDDFYDIVNDLNYPYIEKEITDWLSSKNYIQVDDIKDIPSDFEGELMLFVKTYHVEKVKDD
ncbi:hypothetical protein [Yersinia enterocolitica]|uniref:hypothetical protein n=1 Tax=Yersinia enterocolitica TaxID=630 RepID=UPI00313AD663